MASRDGLGGSLRGRGDPAGLRLPPLAVFSFLLGVASALGGVSLVLGWAVVLDRRAAFLLALLGALLFAALVLLGVLNAWSSVAGVAQWRNEDDVLRRLADLLAAREARRARGPRADRSDEGRARHGERRQPAAGPSAGHGGGSRESPGLTDREKDSARANESSQDTETQRGQEASWDPRASEQPAEDGAVSPGGEAFSPAGGSEESADFPILIDLWLECRDDGRFDASLFQKLLDREGIDLQARSGVDLGLSGAVIGIQRRNARQVTLLPSFNESPEAVAKWFHSPAVSARLARVRDLIRPAVVVLDGVPPTIQKGEVA